MNNTFTARFSSITRTATSLGLAVMVTLATIGSVNHLATEQHAATVMAKAAAAAVQAKAASYIVQG